MFCDRPKNGWLIVATERTKIFGKVHYDVRVEPRDIREEERLLQQKLLEADGNKSKLQIISQSAASSIVAPGSAGAVSWGGSFIVSFFFRSLILIQIILTTFIEKHCIYSQAEEGRGFQGRSYSRKPASGSYLRMFQTVSVLVHEGVAPEASTA